MKKIILLAAILAVPNISFAVAEKDDFSNMNCTQAVTWAASQIASPPPNFTQKEWDKFVSNGGSEAVAIQILSVFPGSPCNTNSLLEKYPASGAAGGKNRGARSAL